MVEAGWFVQSAKMSLSLSRYLHPKRLSLPSHLSVNNLMFPRVPLRGPCCASPPLWAPSLSMEAKRHTTMGPAVPQNSSYKTRQFPSSPSATGVAPGHHSKSAQFTFNGTDWRLARGSGRVASASMSSAVVADKPGNQDVLNVSGGVEGEGHLREEKHPVWKAAIDFRWLKENQDAVRANIIQRKAAGDVDLVVAIYDEWSELKQGVDSMRAQRNAVAAQMKGKVEASRRAELIEEGKRLKDELMVLDARLDILTADLQREGQKIPNMTHPSVPIGGEELAVVRKTIGEKREFPFAIKDHVDLGHALDLFDFDSAAEVTGAKFYYLKNAAVLLEQALVNWTLANLTARGFTPLATPDLVRASVLEKCGFQPRGDNTQVYAVEGTDLCLAGTAEVLVGGMFMDKILTEAQLPLRLVAFSHCFRTEAGAAGREGRGLYRVHQFSKVEMFAISTPEQSDAIHEELISIEEELYATLGLHFKVMDMSSEDLGAPAYRKYDVEAWMPGLARYGEISSASNCTDYQARRLNIRYRPATTSSESSQEQRKGEKGGKKSKSASSPTRFVHTLNATACAVPRMLIAILENFQQPDGSVLVPQPLQPFLGGITVIAPKTPPA